MDPTQLIHPTVGGLAYAVGAVVCGAPLFRDGLRALRHRRHLAALAERGLDGPLAGPVHVAGTVALDSPLFAPISAVPCAGFRLEVHALGASVGKAVDERRPFRLVCGGAAVRVDAAPGRWAVRATAVREVASGEALPASLSRLVDRVPEASWWRRAGGRLRLVERALLPGVTCHVVGSARPARAPAAAAEVERLRTGTDDQPVATLAEALSEVPAPAGEPAIGPGELDLFVVADREPSARELTVPAWRAVGVLAGPALSLLGLLYLAAAADQWRALGRF